MIGANIVQKLSVVVIGSFTFITGLFGANQNSTVIYHNNKAGFSFNYPANYFVAQDGKNSATLKQDDKNYITVTVQKKSTAPAKIVQQLNSGGTTTKTSNSIPIIITTQTAQFLVNNQFVTITVSGSNLQVFTNLVTSIILVDVRSIPPVTNITTSNPTKTSVPSWENPGPLPISCFYPATKILKPACRPTPTTYTLTPQPTISSNTTNSDCYFPGSHVLRPKCRAKLDDQNTVQIKDSTKLYFPTTPTPAPPSM